MPYKIRIAAAALGLAVSTPVLAGEIKPIQNQSIALGDVAGDLYYTVEQDGFHVVATFAHRQACDTPVRFQAVLAPGQAVTFSSPRAAGELPVSVSVRRQDQQVIVADAPLIN